MEAEKVSNIEDTDAFLTSRHVCAHSLGAAIQSYRRIEKQEHDPIFSVSEFVEVT